jgi:hypothetical protein
MRPAGKVKRRVTLFIPGHRAGTLTVLAVLTRDLHARYPKVPLYAIVRRVASRAMRAARADGVLTNKALVKADYERRWTEQH